MWTQIVGGLVLLVVGTYALQYFMPRARSNSNARRTSARWDVAPALGFFGLVLLALSLTEAIRGTVIEVWALGVGLGVMASIGAWIALDYRRDAPAPAARKQSAIIATVRMVRTYGMPVVLTAIGFYLAVRVFGPVVQVFTAGAFGIVLITMALRIFVGVKKTYS